MAAETSPAFLFYVRDWLGDAKVRAMSHEARGVYIDLLAFCWQDGAIPIDEAQIRRIARLTPAKFRRIWPQLEPCFTKTGSGFRQKRLEMERDLQQKRRAVASENGAKGAEARWQGHNSANSKPIAKNAFAFAMALAREEKEQRADARDPDPPNPRVLTRLAYDVPDGLPEADRKDELKDQAVRYGLAYDGGSISAALDAVDRTRR